MNELSSLPKPSVIEDVDYEAILARKVARFKGIWEAIRTARPELDLPPYDVEMMDSDPAMIVLQADATEDMVLRARINDAAMAGLLAFATASDLEHLAAFYGVTRLAGELDDRLKERVVLSIQGRSTGGPKERYKAIAMAADLRVKSVEVYRVGRSPLIHVAIFSTEVNGIASPDLLTTVKAALEADTVQLANDEFQVASAIQRVVNIAADVWLLPNADIATLERAEGELRSAWAIERALGRDFILSWWQAKLAIAGVHRIAPAPGSQDEIAASHEALALGNVTLTLRGRAY